MRIAVVLAMVLAVASWAGSAPAAQTTSRKAARAHTGAAPVIVKMVGDNLTFDPSTVTIRRGQTVEWQNQSRGLIHTVTADPQKVQDKANVKVPAGAGTFDSGYMKPGDTFRHTFTTRGTYKYVCVTHEVQRMFGEVVVR